MKNAQVNESEDRIRHLDMLHDLVGDEVIMILHDTLPLVLINHHKQSMRLRRYHGNTHPLCNRRTVLGIVEPLNLMHLQQQQLCILMRRALQVYEQRSQLMMLSDLQQHKYI